MDLNDNELKAFIHLLDQEILGETRFDRFSRQLYSTDASDYQKLPVGVVIPKNADDISATFRLASQHQLPIIPRGGGSSLSGQTVGTGLIIDHSKYMNRILTINPEEKWLRWRRE